MPPQIPNSNLIMKAAQGIAGAGVISFIVDLTKTAFQSSIIGATANIAGAAASSVAPVIVDAITTAMGSPVVPEAVSSRFPSIIAHIPFVRRLPRWLFPIADTALVLAMPHAMGVKGVVWWGTKKAFGYTISTFAKGAGASAIFSNARNVATTLRDNTNTANLAANLLNPDGVQIEMIPPPMFTPSPVWFEQVDPILRVGLQLLFSGVLVWGCLSLFKKDAPLEVEILPDAKALAASAKDIVILEAGARMASWDSILFVMIKYGVPLLGLGAILLILFKYYQQQVVIENQKFLLEDQKLKELEADLEIANARQVYENNMAGRVRNDRGQFVSDKPKSKTNQK